MSNNNEKIYNIVKQLLQAKKEYYNTGSSDLTDYQFDNLEEELRGLAPFHSYFSLVGIEPSVDENKIEHKEAMLSLDKVKRY